MPKYRIGIDVGGTFTHAVAINDSDYSLAGQEKVPTTHSSSEGVASGIVQSLQRLLSSASIAPHDVVFIAHSTTQATNALLEGDVSPVGIITVGEGVEGALAKRGTAQGDIVLDGGKKIRTYGEFISKSAISVDTISSAIRTLTDAGAGAIVAAEAFSVDDHTSEDMVLRQAYEMKVPCVATYEISGLYGLKTRTATAVINASIMPKMLETAEMTDRCVRDTGISAPLMIMRSDGGVMSIEAMKKRPILTILSGPAAGIASALLYVKVSNGIFLEVGGTSTDIAVIRNGRSIVRTAEIGGRKLYLRTLDSRTIGIAGGSMPRLSGNKIADVGPRSAHIAGLSYCAFSGTEEVKASEPVPLAHSKDDPGGYFSLSDKFGVTMTCAANVLGLTKQGDWSFGSRDSSSAGLGKLSHMIGAGSPENAAEKMLKAGTAKAEKAVNGLLKDYKLDRDDICLIGGGGGAAAVVPFLAGQMKMKYRIAENHAVISAIGAALAMVSDTLERSVIDPGKDDIKDITLKAKDSVISMGASPESVEVTVEIDRHKNVLRARATGAVELFKKDLISNRLGAVEAAEAAANSLKVDVASVVDAGSTGILTAWTANVPKRSCFGLICSKSDPVRVLDQEGVVRFSSGNAKVYACKAPGSAKTLENILEDNTSYGDAGEKVPPIHVLYKHRIIDMSGLVSSEQVRSVFEMERAGFDDGQDIVFIVSLG